MEKFVIELCRDGRVIEYTEHFDVESAIEKLSTPLVNRYYTRLAPPDTTGYLVGDDERYARQCKLLGITNVYA